MTAYRPAVFFALIAVSCHPAHAMSDCNPDIANTVRRLGPEWVGVEPLVTYSHPSGATLGLQCEAGNTVAYIQLAVEQTDITSMHAVVAEVSGNLLTTDVTEKAVRTCILNVKKTAASDASDAWRAVGRFGRAFECGKDDDSHYFRIYIPVSGR